MNLITIYFCFNFNCIGSDLQYNNGALNFENFTRSVFSSKWRNLGLCFYAIFMAY